MQPVFGIAGVVVALVCVGCSEPAAESGGSVGGVQAGAVGADAAADEARLAELTRAVDEAEKAADERTAAFRLELKKANEQRSEVSAQAEAKGLPPEELKKVQAQAWEDLRVKVERIKAEYDAATAANMERVAAARHAVMKQKADMANAKRKREKGAR